VLAQITSFNSNFARKPQS